jgi:LysM repeat protein
MTTQSVSSVSNTNNTSQLNNHDIGSQNYAIKQGDTLSEIALRYGTTVDHLMDLNPQIANRDLIYAGDNLKVPAARSYTIQHGDTLSAIADRFGVSVEALAKANNISNPNIIYPNDTLLIPQGDTTSQGSSNSNAQDGNTSSAGNSNGRVTPGKLPDTKNLSDSQKFDLYESILKQQGSQKAEQSLSRGEKVALSLRVETSTHVNAGNGQYDDRMVLLWKDSNGGKHVQELNANLDPSGQYEHRGAYERKPMGSDVNGDGRLDQGRLAEGTYTFRRGSYRGKDAFLSSSDQVVDRDVNHNGLFDDNRQSPKGNYGMHIHIGGSNNTYSAGCLTLAPSEHSRFFSTVGGQSSLTNVVVDTSSLKASPAKPGSTTATSEAGGKSMTSADWQRAAQSLGVDVASIKAVADVEAAGSGFLSNGQPKILFEAHQFSRLTGGRYNGSHPDISSSHWNRSLYKGGAAEHGRLNKAAALNETAALKSASWGKFQIMGFNYKAAGYSNVQTFVKDMRTSEGKQLDAFVNFIKSNPSMHRALKNHDWATFARLYNGSGYAQNHYDTKIAQAYIKFRNH